MVHRVKSINQQHAFYSVKFLEMQKFKQYNQKNRINECIEKYISLTKRFGFNEAKSRKFLVEKAKKIYCHGF